MAGREGGRAPDEMRCSWSVDTAAAEIAAGVGRRRHATSERLLTLIKSD